MGIEWARRYEARLSGLAIMDEPGLHGPEEWVLGGLAFTRSHHKELVAELSQKADAILARAAEVCTAAGVEFRPLKEIGDPSSLLLIQAQRFDLVLLGQETHFQYGFERRTEDTLARVLQASPRPVVVVPRTPGPGDAAVIAFDGRVQAARALASFAGLGLARGRAVHVFSAAAEHAQAAEIADRAIQFLAAHDIPATAHIAASKAAPAIPLAKCAEEVGAGLVVMGAFGQSVVRELLLGSTTRMLLRETKVPLFVST